MTSTGGRVELYRNDRTVGVTSWGHGLVVDGAVEGHWTALSAELGVLTFGFEGSGASDDEVIEAVEELLGELGYNWLPADRDHTDLTVAIWIVDFPERS
jgi:hypothetical protein